MARVVVPTCVIYSYSIVIPIVKWDVFEDQLKSESTQSQGSRIYQQMQLLGYDSNQTLDNLDSITIFLVVYILKVIFLLGLKVVRNGYGNHLKYQSTFVKLKKSLFFYEFFLIVLEPYIEYLIAGYM
jgi:hypothetical protein